jgi:hypothetical protein
LPAMELHALIDFVLGPQTISLTARTLRQQRADVTVEMPDLRQAPRSVRGDWGPVYTVSIPAGRYIELRLQLGDSDHTTRERLTLETLTIAAPVLADIRRATPLVMELPLREHNLRIRVFYDTEGRVAKADMAPLLGNQALVPVQEDRQSVAQWQFA